ncbi:MAG: putative AlkP superfamily pyrophosphatase or phosphodiesterase [Flavobacteriaceae bacterium]|jgi:predicted AlkP superfamily pyrophosphatase or phosphodiesterase
MRLVIALLFSSLLFTSNAQQKNSPKLVIGIVVDQMCYEYLYRYYDKFCDGGFRKLMENGTNCRNTVYNYIPTYTGPGHASIYTGTTPNNHGIVANDWYSQAEGKSVNCVEDTTVSTVGSTSLYGRYSPKRLRANTITDQLKLTYPGAKVISMSIKNRGAILPGGHMSDGSYWYDFTSGTFITSTFFTEALPNWVAKFNAKKYADKYLKQTWTTIMPIDAYGESGPDNSPYEHLLSGKETPTFPYDLKEMTNDSLDYSLFTSTPFANTFLTDFAIASLKNEEIGADSQTDMLCISYSTPDIIGHAFGPYSVEIEDTYIKLDLEIKRLIQAIEDKVGSEDYVLFLTADHAVVPVPQYLTDHKLPGGYFFRDANIAALKEMLTVQFGDSLVLSDANLNIYLDHDKMTRLGLDEELIQKTVAKEIKSWDGVKKVFTANQLANASIDFEWMDMVRKGAYPRESGDVVFILEPGYLPKHADSDYARKGTSHGSAFSYDTHVPLLWYGKNIPKQEIFRNIDITDIAATLTHMLYIQRANALTGQPIVELFK